MDRESIRKKSIEERIMRAFIRFARKEGLSYKIEGASGAESGKDSKSGYAERCIQLELEDFREGSGGRGFSCKIDLQGDEIANVPEIRAVYGGNEGTAGRKLYEDFLRYISQEEQIELNRNFIEIRRIHIGVSN